MALRSRWRRLRSSSTAPMVLLCSFRLVRNRFSVFAAWPRASCARSMDPPGDVAAALAGFLASRDAVFLLPDEAAPGPCRPFLRCLSARPTGGGLKMSVAGEPCREFDATTTPFLTHGLVNGKEAAGLATRHHARPSLTPHQGDQLCRSSSFPVSGLLPLPGPPGANVSVHGDMSGPKTSRDLYRRRVDRPDHLRSAPVTTQRGRRALRPGGHSHDGGKTATKGR